MIGPDLIQRRTSHSIQYSISCSPCLCLFSACSSPAPLHSKRTGERKEGKRLIPRLERSNSYSNLKSVLSIFSHCLIVPPSAGIKAGFGGYETGLSRNQSDGRLQTKPQTRTPSLSLDGCVRRSVCVCVCLRPNPCVSLESHSSELNQSGLFDSIQTPARLRAGEEERQKMRGELSWLFLTLTRPPSIPCPLRSPSIFSPPPSLPLFLSSLSVSPILILEAGIAGAHFMLRHSLDSSSLLPSTPLPAPLSFIFLFILTVLLPLYVLTTR